MKRAQQKHYDHAKQLLSLVDKDLVDSVVVVGVGSFDEGPAFAETLGLEIPYLGIDPMDYCGETFPGEIIHATAHFRTGMTARLGDRYGKSSVFCLDTRKDRPIVRSKTVALDDVVPDTFQMPLLWLDCEGSEANALVGARKILKRVHYVIAEHRPEPEYPGWCSSAQLFECLHTRGFEEITHVQPNSKGVTDSLFKRALDDYHAGRTQSTSDWLKELQD